MTFSSNRLVVGPTQKRGDARVSCVQTTNTIPPQTRIVVEDGSATVVDQNATYEGQSLIYVSGTLVQMYVAIDVDGSLEWKQVKISTGLLNTSNAQPFSSL